VADPRFYLYPDPSGSLEEIDLGEGLSDIQESPVARVEDAYAGDYVPSRSFLGGALRVRIVLERFGTRGSDDLEMHLQSMVTHLQRGGFVGFSRDHAKTWAGVTSSPPTRGDTTLYTSGGNGFTAWAPAGAVAANDEIAIETPPADYVRELRRCGALTVSPPIHLPLASGCRYTFSSSAVVRWRDFYPVLWMPQDQVGRPFITSDHRRNFTLDLTLEYNPAAVLSLWGEYRAAGSSSLGRVRDSSPPSLRGTGAERGFGGNSLEDLLVGARRTRPTLTRGGL
jgi:hypothetical protein